ncbi:hypothetical protein, partial [Saccharicrinis fermentans]
MKLLFLSVCALFLTINIHSQMVNDADTLIIEEIILLDTGEVVLMPEFIEDYNIGFGKYNEPKMYINTKGLYVNVDSTLMSADLVIGTNKDPNILPDILNNHTGKLKRNVIQRKKEVPFIDIHDSFSEENELTGRLEGDVIKGKKEGLWIERKYERDRKKSPFVHIK